MPATTDRLFPEPPEDDVPFPLSEPPADVAAEAVEDAGPDPRTGRGRGRRRKAADALAPPVVPVEPADDEPPLPDDPEGNPAPKGPSPAERAAATAVLAEQIVARLNPEQARAVTTTEGPLLILAGAGSGKTRVLAHRVAYLVGVKGVRPWQILAVTFTNRAAGELRERISALIGDAGRDVQTGTFHAVCARVLRRDGTAIGLDPRFVIYDTDDQQTLMKQLLREEDLPTTGEFRPSAVLGAISRAKNEMIDADGLDEVALNHHERIVARLARSYQARLRAVGALDFDDILLEAVRLFQEAPEVLARYQEKWRYLHVDEYQDTNRAQYLWVRALAARYHNLAVVGDDDQSIYSWRGADLRNILDFERDEPTATVVKLEQNYRSTQLILDAAHAVVSRNSARKDKKLWTENAGGRPIQRFEAYNEEEEAEWIARQVEELTGGASSILTRRADEDADRLAPREIAVMYRTNAQSRAIEEAFLRYGIRYQLIGGTRFYQRREVKDALAYLRMLRSDTDAVAFERVINVPARGIGEKTIEALRSAVAAGCRGRRGGRAGRPRDVLGRARGRRRRPGGRDRLAHPDGAGGLRRLRPGDAGADRRPAAARAARCDPRAVRLPGDAGRRLRGRRGSLEQPARAARGHDPLRRPVAGGRTRPAPRGDGARRGPGFLRGRGRRGHPDHAPCRQGPRIPGRLHRRPRGRRLPPQPRARRRARARGGTSPGLRRDHPGEASALPVARLATGDVGDGRRVGAVPLPARDPGRADGRPVAGRR